MPDLQAGLQGSYSQAEDVLAYPSIEEANAWYYTNFVEFQAFNYGTNERTLTKIIRLPIPEDLQIGLSPNWSMNQDATGFMLDKLMNAGKGTTVGSAASNVAHLMNIAASKNGFLMNPFQQTFFNHVTFRTIDFNWVLSAKTPEDSDYINQITNTFKYLALPDFPAFSGFIMAYPSEFDITFKFKHFNSEAASKARSMLQQNSESVGGKGLDTSSEYITNTKLFSLDRCVITNVNMNYSPAGAYSNFADGAPVEIGFQLSFQEIQMLSKRRWQDLVAIHGVPP